MMINGEVLVVDDTVTNLEVVSRVLEVAGFEVAVALDGDRALKLATSHLPDLILLDVKLPGLSGFEICQQLKKNPETACIPVILMTALSDPHNKVRGFEAGAVDYVTKPFHEKELLARVKTHLQIKHLNQELTSLVAARTTELQSTLCQLKESQIKLIENEKMSALGNLVAGVAHEINNPLGFIDGSINNAKHYVSDLIEHIELYQHAFPQGTAEIRENADYINLSFLTEDLLKLLLSMKDATGRMKAMSASLRHFSRSDIEYAVEANLHDGLDSTLLILKYRLKATEVRPAITVMRNYSDLPLIDCFPGQLNQVFMNILANTIDMFDEVAQENSKDYVQAYPQVITITTEVERDTAVIRIRDNGKGMSDAVQEKIFDRLFTTKAVGKGTGLGLAISYQIVVEKHGGQLDVFSELGEGSEFCIRLPYEM
ncbi:MAG: response regulator [Cyanobacteria bacterium J06581_3]